MDPYKILGLSPDQIQHPSDLEIARKRAKVLFKRFSSEKKKWDAKKVLDAFKMVETNLKGPLGEGANKILGRSRKERELDKHFNHQTKEIKGNKDLKRTLKKARQGEERFLLPGQKERLPQPKRRRHHRGRRRRGSAGGCHSRRSKKAKLDALEGLKRLVPFLSNKQKFPKAIKLLRRWMDECMGMHNRENLFEVLEPLTSSEFLVEDPDARQDVLQVFEHALRFYADWFSGAPARNLLGTAWRVATVLACQCFTDDAFTLAATIGKLGEALSLIEEHKAELPEAVVKPEVKEDEAKKEEVKDEKEDFEKAVKAKVEILESKKPARKMAAPFRGMAAPVVPSVKEPAEAEAGAESGGEDQGIQEIKSDSDDVKEELVDIDSDDVKEELLDIDSEESIDEEEISSGSDDGEVLSSDCESSGSVEEIEGSVFPTPSSTKSLAKLRVYFVTRCLATLFQKRGPLWARPKVDAFFQDVFYRRAVLTQQQVDQVEAWQARIKVLQKVGEREVGEANNPLEAHRPVRDSRETAVSIETDGDAWAGKQTFDRRDAFGGSKTLR